MIKFSFKWSQGGRGIRRAAKRIADRTRKATARTANIVGKAVRIEAREALAKQLGVPPAVVRRVESVRPAYQGSKTPAYTISWTAKGLPVRRAKATKFEPYKGSKRGKGQRGRLVTRHWRAGKRIVLEGVVRIGRGRGAGFALAETSRHDERGVGGPKVSRGSRPSRSALDPIRKIIPRRFKREFRAQLRRR